MTLLSSDKRRNVEALKHTDAVMRTGTHAAFGRVQRERGCDNVI